MPRAFMLSTSTSSSPSSPIGPWASTSMTWSPASNTSSDPSTSSERTGGLYPRRLDVVVGLAAHHGVHAARVVADHAAQRAVTMGGWVRRKGEVVHLGSVSEIVQDGAGLHPRTLGVGVDLQHLVHVLREVEDDGD